MFVIFLDEGMRNKHSAQADEVYKDILIVPAQLSILFSLLLSGSVN